MAASQDAAIRLSGGQAYVQEVLRTAHQELLGLLQQRADIMRRIGTVKQTIIGLANLFGDELLDDELLNLVDRKASGRQPGFTRACRMVLIESKAPLTAREVVAEMQEKFAGVLVNHKDPLASVTTVLNRLVAYGEAHSTANGSGKRVWEWVADVPANGTGLGAAPAAEIAGQQ
jgi:chorismate mutase